MADEEAMNQKPGMRPVLDDILAVKNQIPIESILSEDVIRRIRISLQDAVTESVRIGGKATLTLNASVLRAKRTELLADPALPAEAKKFLNSPLGLVVIQIFAMMIGMLIEQQCSNLREHRSDESMKELTELVEKIADLLQNHTEKAPTPPSNGGD